MSSLERTAEPSPPESPPTAPASADVQLTQVPLTSSQRTALQALGRPKRIITQAFALAASLPLVLAYIVFALTRVAARIPLIGLVLGLYGLVFAVSTAFLGALASPLVFVVAIPFLALARRPSLKADLAGGAALVRTGTFAVKDRKAGGTLQLDEIKLKLSSREMGRLRPALQGTQQPQTFTGSVIYAPRSRTVLLVSDENGSELFAAQ